MGILLFVALGVAVTLAIVQSYRKARTFITDDWDSLVSQLLPVPSAALEKVAMEHLRPDRQQVGLEAEEMWTILGGWEGIERMGHNADLMIRLAAYVRVWNFDEAVIVSERIRQDAIVLKRALMRIRIQIYFSRYKVRIPFHVHQAASSYYLMTRRLLSLYETNQYLLYPRLAEAL
jgi:hypothetical protein